VRALALALAASLGLHGSVLFVAYGAGNARSPSPVPVTSIIDVSLVEPMELSAEATSPGEAPSEPRTAPRARPARPRSRSVAQSVPAEVPSLVGDASEQPLAEDGALVLGDDKDGQVAAGAVQPAPGASGGCSSGETRAPGAHTGEAPSYPAAAKQSGVQGTTRVRLLVSPAGMVTEAVVTQSSGSRALDNAAVAALLRWRFQPALRSGEPATAQVIVPVVFSLR
jgi:periplasmic protein TonB